MDGGDADVLIVGGGPVGLLTAYCLARYGVSTYVVEQRERAEQERYGRAAMIAPRTLELLDQLDLADALGQIGFVARGQVAYKSNGEKTEGINTATSDIMGTFFDYGLLCRQRYTEDVMREGYERSSGNTVHYGHRLVDFRVCGCGEDTKVVANIEIGDRSVTVRTKYIIGADGGRSKVRELAEIPFEGELSNRQWIRIDGIVETNMPEARRGISAIQSESHGSVLWACLDHGATRVGFALPEELWARLGTKITRDDVVCEAKKAVQPFTLEFKSVDWWTVYAIGQRLASTYRVKERIFIAGDAAHTHSSGAAQGMNTGIHDAVNLSWKLAGYLNDWLDGRVLDTYSDERRPIAQRIIEQDKIISKLTGGEIPVQFRDHPNADPHKILTEVYKANVSFNTGLGISYPQDNITVGTSDTEYAGVKVGERAPDVVLQKPGIQVPVRLQSLIKYSGKFTIVMFSGDPTKTQILAKNLHDRLVARGDLRRFSAGIQDYLTIIVASNDSGSVDECFGAPCFGRGYYDVQGSAHERYGVMNEKGAIFALRPDGTVGFRVDMDSPNELCRYFGGFIKSEHYVDTRQHITAVKDVGEISLDQE